MSCSCEVSRDHEALADELARLALALTQAYATFGNVVNLLKPAHNTYDTRLVTVQRAVTVCEEAIQELPVGEA